MPSKTKKQKKPRQEHPYLVGCTHKEAALIARGAAKFGMGPIEFLRDSAIFQARDALGLKQSSEP